MTTTKNWTTFNLVDKYLYIYIIDINISDNNRYFNLQYTKTT